jgi:hypothetical protein
MFNKRMLEFYESNDKAPMVDFMLDCLEERLLEIMCE